MMSLQLVLTRVLRKKPPRKKPPGKMPPEKNSPEKKTPEKCPLGKMFLTKVFSHILVTHGHKAAVYLEPLPTSKMVLFANIVKGLKL